METGNLIQNLCAHRSIRKYSTIKSLLVILLLVFISISISGCVTLNDPEASQDYTSDTVGILDPETNIGQSFVSRRQNLDGITIWITVLLNQDDGTPINLSHAINVKLFHAQDETLPIYATTIVAPASGNNIPITISTPPQNNPAGQHYYLLLSADSGSIQLNGRDEDAYAEGQAYVNGIGVNADLAFRLSYDYGFSALAQDLSQYSRSAWMIFPLLVLLWLPGWLLLDFSGLRHRFDFGEEIGMAIGISLALTPILMLWTTIFNIKWSRDAVLISAGLLTAIYIGRSIFGFYTSWRKQSKYNNETRVTLPKWYRRIIGFFTTNSFLLVLIFLATLVVRLVMVRDLATPAWVDSVHHALITRLILDSGIYPSTYQPFIDITSTTYHPGFHSLAASFVWLTNLDLPQALLILGQVLNAISVFSVYLLTKTLTRSSNAALFAAVITGFLTPMPAYYTSWSRYTELTGLLILPIVLALISLWFGNTSNKKIIWIIILGAISAGGLFMVHYRVVVFMLFLVLSFLLYHSIIKNDRNAIKPFQLWIFTVIMAIASMVMVLPWVIPTITNTVLPKINPPALTTVPFFQDFSWPYLSSALGMQAMVLASLGFVWSLIKQRSLALIISVWLIILFFLANLNALKLPGAGLITNISVEIILFIPISILGGYFVDQLIFHWKIMIPQRFFTAYYALVFIFVGFISYLGAKQLVAIINPITILTRNADLPAIQWISENIPEDETIVINPFAWGYGLYAGNDGGYWIESLSERLTIPPPVLYGLGSDAKLISQQSQEITTLSIDPAAFRDYLLSSQYHYVFTGARGGVIPPAKLASSGLFTILYHQAGVWILSVKP